jgi:succinate dehydrogenase / fumarate reductase iron-sulfur subunit
MNGQAGLACKTKILSVTHKEEPIHVEPMTNMPVIKDLVTDMGPFWEKIRQINPWLQPQNPPPHGEYVASAEDMSRLSGVMTCIMCGVCVSDCTVLEVDSTFVGPAALAKAYRFVMDPRDVTNGPRLRALNESGGMWDCTRCMECIQVCPKGVAPMDRIMSLRADGMALPVDSTCGSRHAHVFTDLVRQKGVLDEPMLAIRTFGFKQISRLVEMIPMVVRSLVRGKIPWSGPLHRAIPGVEQIRRLFKLVERKS